MKRPIAVIVSAAVLFIGVFSSLSTSNTSNAVTNNTRSFVNSTPPPPSPTPPPAPKPKQESVCDGMTITENCVVDGIRYSTYIYHPPVAEKSHVETVTTYEKEVVGYCTLCNDGTYSPSCATGRGACSHHGGVAQWNAPQYRNVPKTARKTIIDSPAQEAFYEKVLE